MPLVPCVGRAPSYGRLERLEPDIGKLICPVLRGGVDGNAAPLPDSMKLTVLDQYAKGLVPCDQVLGEKIRQQIERLKWSLWHGNLYKARDKIEDIESLLYNFEETYPKFKPLLKGVEEFRTYRLLSNFGDSGSLKQDSH
jgi:virulence-associated protein VapD